MASDLRVQVHHRLWNRTTVEVGRLSDAFRHLRLLIPEPVAGSGAHDADEMRWSSAERRESPLLDTVFWDFLQLRDATPEQIRSYAQTHGPLAPHLPASESILAWRMFARGLGAVYEAADRRSRHLPLDSEAIAWFPAAITIPLWLDEPADQRPDLTLDDFESFLSYQILSGDRVADLDSLDHVIAAALDVGGALPPFRWGGSASSNAYALRATAVSTSGSSPADTRWTVRGLLPILVVALAVASQTIERPLCSRCNRPAAILERGPRGHRPWYGDHDDCRMLSLKEAVRSAEVRRQQKRKRLPVDSPTNRDSIG